MFAEGVPAVVKKRDITDEDRLRYFGVLPSAWTRYEGERIEQSIRRKTLEFCLRSSLAASSQSRLSGAWIELNPPAQRGYALVAWCY